MSLIIGDNEYKLLTWETQTVSQRSNKIGPTVNIILPLIENADFMLLKLRSKYADRCNEYRLKYYPREPKRKTMQLNI